MSLEPLSVLPPVFVISLAPSLSAVLRLEIVRADHPGARIVLLTRAGAQAGLTRQADEVWSEGLARGPGRFLALARRISWMSFGHVYDFDGTLVTRFLRLCVWPRPHWHSLEP